MLKLGDLESLWRKRRELLKLSLTLREIEKPRYSKELDEVLRLAKLAIEASRETLSIEKKNGERVLKLK